MVKPPDPGTPRKSDKSENALNDAVRAVTGSGGGSSIPPGTLGTLSSPAPEPEDSDNSFKVVPVEHPEGLKILYRIEFAERISFYGMKALLATYVINESGLHLPAAEGQIIVGSYGGLGYLMGLLGGHVASKYIGQRMAVLTGGALMAAGHLALTVPSFFYQGLALLITGVGFFKPNVSTMLGGLYRGEKKSLIDQAYAFFYQGINLGAFVAPLICGTLGETVSYHLGFGLAGIIMCLSLMLFLRGEDKLKDSGLPPGNGETERTLTSSERKKSFALAGTLGVASIGVSLALPLISSAWNFIAPGLGECWTPSFLSTNAVGGVLPSLWHLGVLSGLGWLAYRGLSKGTALRTIEEKKNLGLIGLMTVANTVFFSGQEQIYTTLNQLVKDRVDRHFLSWEIPVSWFTSVNPLCIVLMAFPFARLLRVKRIGSLPMLAKAGIGLLFLGGGFGLIKSISAGTGPISPLWMVASYAIFTVGELWCSALGLAAVKKLAPKGLDSMMMGVFMMSYSLANFVSGYCTKFVENLNEEYHSALDVPTVTTYLATASGVFFIAASYFLRSWERHEEVRGTRGDTKELT